MNHAQQENSETEIQDLQHQLAQAKLDLETAKREKLILQDRLALATKKLSMHLAATTHAIQSQDNERRLLRQVSTISPGSDKPSYAFNEIRQGKYKWGPLIEAMHDCSFAFTSENITNEGGSFWSPNKQADLFVKIQNPTIQAVSFYASANDARINADGQGVITIYPSGGAKIKIGRFKVGTKLPSISLMLINGDQSYLLSLTPQRAIKV